MTLQYKVPLRCDDIFISRLAVEKQGVKFIFHQDLFRESDEQLAFRATVELVVMHNGSLCRTSPYDDILRQS